MQNYRLSYLDELEAEAIYVLREAAAQFNAATILFSGGKDSMVVVHLAIKAFAPALPPFRLMHVDSGHNFPETIEFRDRVVEQSGLSLVVASVQESIDKGRVREESGKYASRNRLQTTALLDAIEEHQIDACIGGARRDEEKSRAKERFFSHRDEFGQWDPRNQRPELWKIYNTRHHPGEHFRVFPLNNWTEEDIWKYILRERIQLPSLYFSHERKCVRLQGSIIPYSDFLPDDLKKDSFRATVRFRTLGDITITGAVESEASSVEEIIEELKTSEFTERGNRADDKRSISSMEDRKREGYF